MCDIPGATNNQKKGGERMRTTDAMLFGLSGTRDKTPQSRMDRMQNQTKK